MNLLYILLFIFAHNTVSASMLPKILSLNELNTKITLAEKYYEGLYKSFDKNTAVVAEYYSGNKSVYTVRHGVIGGIFYYAYTNQKEKAIKLLRFANKYGFNIYYDDHSFIWTDENFAPIGITSTLAEYHDCHVTLPESLTIFPYHSKVCKLGIVGQEVYIFFSKFDPLVEIQTGLQEISQKQSIPVAGLEKKYDTLGFGMPICTPLGCSKFASTIRTAQFGELEMRLGKMKYADSVAYNIVKAMDRNGAIYTSYDKSGKLVQQGSIIYSFIDKLLNDKPIYNGYIPSNAETMNDSLAFLLQYRCQKYGVCVN